MIHNDISYKFPHYSIDKNLNCYICNYKNKTYLFDIEDGLKIKNEKKKFVFRNKDDDYPSFKYNNREITYFNYLYKLSSDNSIYIVFKNKNKYDLRRSNVEINHIFNKYVREKYNVIEYIPGHIVLKGADSNKMKNPIWKIEENNEIYYLMFCCKNCYTILCEKSYKKILYYEINKNDNNKITWCKSSNGYIIGSNNIHIHQIILNCYGNGKGTSIISVDHIDRNPLNNKMSNLRLATREMQEQNSNGIMPGTKRKRSSKAKPLPEGINESMLQKYVVYYREFYDKEKTKEREYFKVEKHPKSNKIWMTTKSSKFTILEKLEQANKIVDDLDNDIEPKRNT